MVDIRELRIGNFVSVETKEGRRYVQCNELLGDYVRYKYDNNFGNTWLMGDNYNDIEPIPLTSKILEKCGFVRHVYGLRIQVGNKLFVDYDPDTREISISSTTSEYDLDIWADINSLHQLQNLFYCLTGTELNYEL